MTLAAVAKALLLGLAPSRLVVFLFTRLRVVLVALASAMAIGPLLLVALSQVAATAAGP